MRDEEELVIPDEDFDEAYLEWLKVHDDVAEGFPEWLQEHCDMVTEEAVNKIQRGLGVSGNRLSKEARNSYIIRSINSYYNRYKNLLVVKKLFDTKQFLSRRDIVAAVVPYYEETWQDETVNQIFGDFFSPFRLVGKRTRPKGSKDLVYSKKNWDLAFHQFFEEADDE